MEKILRGVIAEFVPDGQVIDCHITVTSEDSHLSHDITTTIATTHVLGRDTLPKWTNKSQKLAVVAHG
ncbi:MAG: hypothetical protein VXZ96_01085 [Myxococcota bacterium]|nr:hypothetical protein [Myxococcota bacterium]